MIRNFNP
jgi:uncharacterized protein YbjT (DUF2867 family)